MIIKTGIDILKKSRIEKILNSKLGDKFLKKILSEEELADFEKIKNNEKKCSFIAKKFSTKESISKAIGTGIQNSYLKFSDIHISKDKFGAPIINQSKKIDETISTIYKNNKYSISISISDEKDLVISSSILVLY